MKKMIVGAAALVAAGFLTVSAPTTAEAAQGCGPGAGRDAFGFCRPFWGPRPVYRPVRYGWYGPRYYRPVRYGWHRPHYYRPVRYGWGGSYGYYRPAYRPVVSVGFGFGGGPGFW